MIFENGEPLDYTYLLVNPAFEIVCGLQDVVGKRVTEVIPGIRESNPEMFVIFGRVSLTGKPEKFELFVDVMKMSFSVSVYGPEKGFFVTMFRDITERKRAEEALRGSESRLRQAQKMEAIGTLAGGIAHDFNNILFAIQGYTEIAMAGLPSDSKLKPLLTEVLTGSVAAPIWWDRS